MLYKPLIYYTYIKTHHISSACVNPELCAQALNLSLSDGIAGLQKYKSCKWGGTQSNVQEAEACFVVITGLWDMHKRKFGEQDQQLRLCKSKKKLWVQL